MSTHAGTHPHTAILTCPTPHSTPSHTHPQARARAVDDVGDKRVGWERRCPAVDRARGDLARTGGWKVGAVEQEGAATDTKFESGCHGGPSVGTGGAERNPVRQKKSRLQTEDDEKKL